MRYVITTLTLAVCLLVVVSAALAQSQLGAGSISGTVSDSSGAVIPGATVTITNTGTGLVRTLTTGDSGQFIAPALPVGEYAARVEKTGFATLEQKGLIVNVGGTATLRLELKPGEANEVVNVAAEQTLDASRTEETTLINRIQINDLPINGRRADQFALLATGASGCSAIAARQASSTTLRSKATTIIKPIFPKGADARASPATSAPM